MVLDSHEESVVSNDPTHGILDFAAALRSFRLQRRQPSALLAPWIESYWEVRWALPPGTVHRQTNLSHACVNATVEDDGAWLYGVPGPTFVREISGVGRVFGIKFRPGAFYPWYRRPLRSLFDRRFPLAEALGAEVETWRSAVLAEEDFARRAVLSDGFWEALRPPSAPGDAVRCAETVIADRSLIRVEDACGALGYDLRRLQRLFRREVGVGPKEVIRRYRLMEAAERLAKEESLSGIDLAYSLGYADQAHFIRDFKAVTGAPPEAYRKRQKST
jgi:AraC-like DNA-binding protein